MNQPLFDINTFSVMQEKISGITFPRPQSIPSYWIPMSSFSPIDTELEPFNRIFVDTYLITGRVSHLNRVLCLHPSFFEKYFATLNFIMRAEGPLPVPWRWYIAILVSEGIFLFVKEIYLLQTWGKKKKKDGQST